MNRRYALWGKGVGLAGIVLLMVALTSISSTQLIAQADKPELPTLTLTGAGNGWNSTYYPDGRIWVPRRGTNGPRQLLVPVFIKNCWRTTSTYEAFPIYSFKFKVQYDSVALQFVGIEKNGPLRGNQLQPLGCLAKDFEFSADIARDTTYQDVIGAPAVNRYRGKRVMVSGFSAKPLPQTGDPSTSCETRPYVELVYLRFNVTANPADGLSGLTPLILTNDTLYYNDFQVGFEKTFPNDPVPGTYAGLGGVDNYFFDNNNIEQCRDVPRYSRFGMIWMQVTDEIPRLSFTNIADRRARIVDSVDFTNNAEWYVVNPITLDSGSTFDDRANGLSTRDINVINATAGSRMTDLVVQSDKEWLKFKTFTTGGQGEINPIPSAVRQGVVPIIDKSILGTTAGQTPLGEQTVGQRDLNMRIICDPTSPNLPNGEGIEAAGIYTGHLTFKSSTMDVSPVRLKVTFIYFRAPFEPNEFDENNSWQQGPSQLGKGVTLEVRNSNNPNDRTYVTFGVGARATDMCDTLFGETIYETPLGGFGARWYPKNTNGTDIYPYGLGDLWTATNDRPQGASRDIRDIYNDSTLVYECRFNAGSPIFYPIVVSWDTDEFIPGSELFIRDNLNGTRFNVNMRQATNIGGSRYSYTIRDADIDAFVIEYTLPKVVGFPVINKGWNLLSLPVNPSSAYWKDIYPNALNIPIRFSQNSYQPNEVNLQPGYGYFMKYADDIDRTIAGVRINRIDENTYATRLYDGWNTIGSLSKPISTDEVELVAAGSGSTPVIEGDIYAYVTDRGYRPVTEIQSGIGYFMKVRGSAYLKMVYSGPRKAGSSIADLRNAELASTTRISVADNSLRNAELNLAENAPVSLMNLFELPPVPPHNLFDVRFSNGATVENSATPVINLQGATFPVTVTIDAPARSYTVVNAVTGEALGTIAAGTIGSVTINNERTSAIRLMGLTAVENGIAVTPNPISNRAEIEYGGATAGRVSMKIYSMMGEEMATLVDENKVAGLYTYDLNASNLPAGRYIVKMVNGTSVTTSTVSVVR
jgi:hypothetical protein